MSDAKTTVELTTYELAECVRAMFAVRGAAVTHHMHQARIKLAKAMREVVSEGQEAALDELCRAADRKAAARIKLKKLEGLL